MLITLFFKTGNLYETLYDLYNVAFSKQIQDLQDKLINLRNVKPKSLNVQVKFCLDDDTLELQKNILKEKREEKNKKEGEKLSQEKKNDAEDTNTNINTNKNLNISKNQLKEAKTNELDLIKEGDDEEEKDDDDEVEINTKLKNNAHNDSGYLLEKIGLLDDSKDDNNNNDNVPIFSGFSQFRNTVNSFNNKKFMFPKLHNKLRDTIAIKDDYNVSGAVIEDGKPRGF